jgi:alpha-L-fucosidase 2
MLLQSHAAEVHLLPALPDGWPQGEVRGLRARGGFAVSLSWQNGKLTEAIIQSAKATTVKVRLGDKVVNLKFRNGERLRLDGTLRRR